MPKLVVINKGLHYGGRSFDVGQTFIASEVDAGWLKKTRRAEDLPPVQAAAAASQLAEPQCSDEQPDAATTSIVSEGEEAADGPAAPSRSRYKRRDLRAED